VIRLGKPKISGCFVLDTVAPKLIARIGKDAAQPAALAVLNEDSAAIVYLKTVKRGDGVKVSSTDHGLRLVAGASYDWNGCPPRDSDIYALSTVANSVLSAEGNWCLPEDE